MSWPSCNESISCFWLVSPLSLVESKHLFASAPRLLKGCYQIINVWRPIRPLPKDPLGIADATSALDEDILPVQSTYPVCVVETFLVKPKARHCWFHLQEQTPGVTLLVECFEWKARRAPHSAVLDCGGKSPRKGIEVKALVLQPDDVE